MGSCRVVGVAVQPRAEIPIFQDIRELFPAVEPELLKDVTDMDFDRFGGDLEAFRDLLVGIAQTDQRGHIFLARRQLFPYLKLLLQKLMLF